jgi:uncharacterized iron-regulated membrane protein
MMYGSFGLGGLIILLIIGFLVLVILGIVVVGVYIYNRNKSSTTHSQGYQVVATPNPAVPKSDRYCVHCGAGLQAGWSHCPQCGAPIS